MTGLRPVRRPQKFGFAEWLRLGEHERVVSAVAGMRAAGASYVRTHLSWAEYHQPGGQEWYDWLIPTLGRAFDLLPCFHYTPCLAYTPPSVSRTGRASGAPHRMKDYADFVDHVLSRYGDHFRYVELWNEPNNLLDWTGDMTRTGCCSAKWWEARRTGWSIAAGRPCWAVHRRSIRTGSN
jgi:CDP-paratose 2-epimerase